MLYGHTKIELTDINTGEIEVYEDSNRITSFVTDILSNHPFGSAYRNTSIPVAKLFPAIPTLIGGIALYYDKMGVNSNFVPYAAPMSNPLKGYAQLNLSQNWTLGQSVSIDKNNVIDNTDPRHGIMSPRTTSLSDGYQFVFNFSPEKANGTIRTVCLVPHDGGHAMLGNDLSQDGNVNRSNAIKVLDSVEVNSSNLNNALICAIDPAENAAYAVYPSGTKSLKITKLIFPTNELGLNDTFHFPLTTYGSITYTTPGEDNLFDSTKNTSFVFDGDAENGFIWGFEKIGSGNNTRMKWMKISMQTLKAVFDCKVNGQFNSEEGLQKFTYSSGSFLIPSDTHHCGNYTHSLGSSYSNRNYIIVQKYNDTPYLYCIKGTGSDLYGVYKITLDSALESSVIRESVDADNNTIYVDSNIITIKRIDFAPWTDTTSVSLDFDGDFNNGASYSRDYYYYYTNTFVNNIGGTICYPRCYINGRNAESLEDRQEIWGDKEDMADENKKGIGEYLYPTTHTVTRTTTAYCPGFICFAKPNLYYGPFLLGFGYWTNDGTNTMRYTCGLPMNFLATVNDLSTPIYKDPNKSMQITYTIKKAP